MDSRTQWRLAVDNGSTSEIDSILARLPLSISDKDSEEKTILYDLAYQGRYNLVEYLLKHSAYKSLPASQEKYDLLRDVVVASSKLAQNAFQEKDFPLAREALTKAFFYAGKIIDKNEYDYEVLGSAYCLSVFFFLQEKKKDQAFRNLEEALFLLRKVNYKTDNLLHNLIFCSIVVGQRYAKNKPLEKSMFAFQDGLTYCYQLSDTWPYKAEFIAILENNIANAYNASLIHEAKLWGYSDRLLKSDDENSFYYAVVDQLRLQKLIPDLELENVLKLLFQAQAEHIRQFESLYLSNFDNTHFHAYLSKLSHSGIWTMDHAIMVLALSRCLNVNLIIFRCDGEQPIVIKQNSAVTLHLGIGAAEKYRSFMRCCDAMPDRSLEEYSSLFFYEDFHSTQAKLAPARANGIFFPRIKQSSAEQKTTGLETSSVGSTTTDVSQETSEVTAKSVSIMDRLKRGRVVTTGPKFEYATASKPALAEIRQPPTMAVVFSPKPSV